jgi:hypothetical protein
MSLDLGIVISGSEPRSGTRVPGNVLVGFEGLNWGGTHFCHFAVRRLGG